MCVCLCQVDFSSAKSSVCHTDEDQWEASSFIVNWIVKMILLFMSSSVMIAVDYVL